MPAVSTRSLLTVGSLVHEAPNAESTMSRSSRGSISSVTLSGSNAKRWSLVLTVISFPHDRTQSTGVLGARQTMNLQAHRNLCWKCMVCLVGCRATIGQAFQANFQWEHLCTWSRSAIRGCDRRFLRARPAIPAQATSSSNQSHERTAGKVCRLAQNTSRHDAARHPRNPSMRGSMTESCLLHSLLGR